MFRKSHIAAGALIFAGSLLATAPYPSFEVTFRNSVRAGDLQLKPDSYRISRSGGDAVFRDLNNNRVYRTPAMIEHVGEKNPMTQVQFANVNGEQQIQRILLGNHRVDLVFNR